MVLAADINRVKCDSFTALVARNFGIWVLLMPFNNRARRAVSNGMCMSFDLQWNLNAESVD